MSASRSAANSPLRCSSHRSAASPSSPDDRQLARARLFLRRKRRTPTAPSSAPSPQQIALNDPLEASRAATAASLSSDRFRHRESISSCLPFSTVTQPALVLFPNQIRIYSQQAPRQQNRLQHSNGGADDVPRSTRLVQILAARKRTQPAAVRRHCSFP